MQIPKHVPLWLLIIINTLIWLMVGLGVHVLLFATPLLNYEVVYIDSQTFRWLLFIPSLGSFLCIFLTNLVFIVLYETIVHPQLSVLKLWGWSAFVSYVSWCVGLLVIAAYAPPVPQLTQRVISFMYQYLGTSGF